MVSIDAQSESRWNRQIISIESTVNLQVQGVPRKYKFCTPRELYFCKNCTNLGLIAVFLFSTKNVICDLCNSKVPLFVFNPQKRWLSWFYQRFMSNSWKLFQDHRSNLWLIKILQRKGFGNKKKKSSKWNLKKISLKFSWFCSKI